MTMNRRNVLRLMGTSGALTLPSVAIARQGTQGDPRVHDLARPLDGSVGPVECVAAVDGDVARRGLQQDRTEVEIR